MTSMAHGLLSSTSDRPTCSRQSLPLSDPAERDSPAGKLEVQTPAAPPPPSRQMQPPSAKGASNVRVTCAPPQRSIVPMLSLENVPQGSTSLSQTSITFLTGQGYARHCQAVPGPARMDGRTPFPLQRRLPLQHHTTVCSMTPVRQVPHGQAGHGQAWPRSKLEGGAAAAPPGSVGAGGTLPCDPPGKQRWGVPSSPRPLLLNMHPHPPTPTPTHTHTHTHPHPPTHPPTHTLQGSAHGHAGMQGAVGA